MTTTAIPKSVSDFLQRITDLCGTEHADWAENFNACFADTLTTTVKRHDDGTTFCSPEISRPCGCVIRPRNYALT